MRKKIKEILNKEEGFTLVELLAVIVILGIIVAIAVPSIGNVIGDSRTAATDANTELIQDAARLYDVEKESKAKSKVASYNVLVTELIDGGYLDERDGATPTGGVKVFKVTDGGTRYKYDSSLTASSSAPTEADFKE